MAFGTDQAWGAILPVEKTNLLRNPSLEQGYGDFAKNSWDTFAGRTSEKQTFGAFSFQTSPNTGGGSATKNIAWGPWTAGVGVAYTISVYARGTAYNSGAHSLGSIPDPLFLRVASGTDVADALTFYANSTVVFGANSVWQRYDLSYTEASGGARYLILQDGTNNNGTTGGKPGYFFDGAQVEVGSLTTYIDGDQEGCYWTGAPHLSESVRSGTSRAGGTVIALADLGFRVSESPGIGMPPLETTAQSFALTDGAEFQRQRAKERVFTLAGFVQGTATQTRISLHQQRQVLIDALKIDLVSPQQPTRFWYVGGAGTVAIDAVMDAGLGFDLNIGEDGFTESPGVRFIAHDPFFYATTDQGTALAASVNLGSTNYAAYRDPLGRWGTMGVNGTTVSGQVFAVGIDLGGTVFYGGQFLTAGGTRSPAIAMYLPTTGRWGTLTGGTIDGSGQAVQAIAFTPSGTLFVGGLWDSVGGTTAPNVGQWNGAWGTLGPGTVNNQVLTLEYTVFGTLFAGGVFTQVGGTQAPRIAMWTPARWGTLVGGTVNNTVYTITSDVRGTVYTGGDFTEAGGTAGARFLALWNGAWGSFTGGTVNTRVYALAFGQNGILYVGGVFYLAGGGTTGPIANWNQTSFTGIGGGLSLTSGSAQVNRILSLNNGQLLASGVFNRANTRIVNDNFAQFNNAAWLTTDIDVGNTAVPIYGMAQGGGGTVYIGGGFTGTATAASVTQIYNTGRTETYPVFVMRNTSSGTARLYQLINTLTGDAVYFDLALLPGEVATLELSPLERTLVTSFRGNSFSAILPGSRLSTLRLLPGTNWISCFADTTNLVTSIYWRPRSWSADAGTTL